MKGILDEYLFILRIWNGLKFVYYNESRKSVRMFILLAEWFRYILPFSPSILPSIDVAQSASANQRLVRKCVISSSSSFQLSGLSCQYDYEYLVRIF